MVDDEKKDQSVKNNAMDRKAVYEHYVTGPKYAHRMTEIEKAYDKQIEKYQKVLAHKDEIKYKPEETIAYAESIIELERSLKENMSDVCAPIGEIARLLANPNIASKEELERIPGQILASAGFINEAEKIPTGAALINRAMKNGVLACSQKNIPQRDGFYDPGVNVLNVATSEIDKGQLTGHDFLAFYEELFHADQIKSRKIDRGFADDDNLKNKSYDIKDIFVWGLGVEANAKIAAALMVLEHSEKGDDNFRQDILSHGFQISDPVFRAVNQVYEEKGMAAIRKDPMLLAPAFEFFFSEKGNASDYLDMYLLKTEAARVGIPEDYKKAIEGKKPLFTIKDFTQAFGEVYGLEGNLLQGRYETREDLIKLFPEDSTFRKWLQNEFKLGAEGPVVFETQPAGQTVKPPSVKR